MNENERQPPIPLAKPWLDDREAAAVQRVLRSGWVTQGPEVEAFEDEFAAAVGAPHACAVSSCTAALHLALIVVGVRPGDEVVTVSHTFVATTAAVRYCGAVPVFVDIEPRTFNMDPARLDAAITEKTCAILCVHQMGMPCAMPAICEIARRRGLPVVEDAACAIGSEIAGGSGWERIGRPHGDVACFSFHPRKILTTGDGGMIVTTRANWDRQFRLLRQHGMGVSDRERHDASRVVFESYERLGFNYRMTDIQAAVGRVQLQRLPEAVERRRAIAARYGALLSAVSGLGLRVEPAWARSNWQSYCVRLPEACDRRAVMQRLLDRGVATRRGVGCVHLEPAFADQPWRCGGPSLRESEQASERGLALPIFHEMTEDQQDRVVSALADACAAPGE